MQDWIVAAPAYGRDYKNKKDAVAAFVSGKDWLLMGLTCTYFSIRDLQAGTKVELRYNKRRNLTIYEVTGNE